MRAQVLQRSIQDFWCRSEDGEVFSAKITGNLVKRDKIVCGDYVHVLQENSGFLITEREQRKSEIFRLITRERKKKIIAANCDYQAIVVSCEKPHYKRGLVDRFLMRGKAWGVKSLLIFNKGDLPFSRQLDLPFEVSRLQNLAVSCFEVSAHDSNYQARFLEGIESLRQALTHKTTIFVGQSGVGKSRLISHLLGQRDLLKSDALGKVGKGQHITTAAQLIYHQEFKLLDSPGIRSFSLRDLPSDDVFSLFPDLQEMAQECEYKNCRHLEGDKGCGFLKISQEDLALQSRLDSYRRFLREAQQIPEWEKNS